MTVAMKRLVYFTLLFLLGPTLLTAQVTGHTYAQAKATGKATITLLHLESPGFAATNAQQQIEGLCPELMAAFVQYIKTQEGIDVTVNWYTQNNPRNFPQFMQAVKAAQGGVFGFGNVTITEARKQHYQFSPPYITNINVIATNQQAPTLTNLANIATTFQGMTAYTLRGSTNEAFMLELKKRHFPKLEIAYVNSGAALQKKLTDDPKAFGSLDFTFFLDALRNKKPLKRHPVDLDHHEEFGVIMPLNNDWAPLLQRFMQTYVQSADYRRILVNNLGPTAVRLLRSITTEVE